MKRHQEIALGADEDVRGNLQKGCITKFAPVPTGYVYDFPTSSEGRFPDII